MKAEQQAPMRAEEDDLVGALTPPSERVPVDQDCLALIIRNRPERLCRSSPERWEGMSSSGFPAPQAALSPPGFSARLTITVPDWIAANVFACAEDRAAPNNTRLAAT
jgi:hypothetical protein